MGGLIQLVATGAQNVYLTGDPQISFFKTVFKRHTNFSMECIEQNINGEASRDGTSSITISRSGDLVREVFLEATLKDRAAGWRKNDVYPMERLIASCELMIGGQQIDVHYQRWWRLYSELYHGESKKTLYSKLVNSEGPDAQIAYLPFIFFFNRHPGLALPLVALQYHEVRLDITWTPWEVETYVDVATIKCWANYIFLDVKERNLFSSKSHTYLIEQVQYTGAAPTPKNGTTKVRLFYDHPVKELIWCFPLGIGGDRLWNMTARLHRWVYSGATRYSIYTPNPQPHESLGVVRFEDDQYFGEDTYGPLSTFKLLFNGADRFGTQAGKYFNQIQPYYHHSGNPIAGVYSYSFALKPELLQPSGTCNFSRIDNITAVPTMKNLSGGDVEMPELMEMFAINYNVLRIMQGMGGLAFAD